MTRVVALVAIVGLPVIAHTVPSCLQPCDLSKKSQTDCCLIEPCLSVPCGDYLGCRADAQANRQDCINRSTDCFPAAPGRCTVVLGCVRTCDKLYRSAIKQCEKDAFGTITGCSTGSCTIRTAGQRRTAARVCNACTSATTTSTVTTTTTVTATTGTAATTTVTTTTVATATTTPQSDLNVPCLKPCLLRIDSLRECYQDCESKCENVSAAEKICKEACRNSTCSTIKVRCADDRDPGVENKADVAYLQCCRNKDSCITSDEAPCKVTTTTTSTSTTRIATTSTASSTSTTTSTL